MKLDLNLGDHNNFQVKLMVSNNTKELEDKINNFIKCRSVSNIDVVTSNEHLIAIISYDPSVDYRQTYTAKFFGYQHRVSKNYKTGIYEGAFVSAYEVIKQFIESGDIEIINEDRKYYDATGGYGHILLTYKSSTATLPHYQGKPLAEFVGTPVSEDATSGDCRDNDRGDNND